MGRKACVNSKMGIGSIACGAIRSIHLMPNLLDEEAYGKYLPKHTDPKKYMANVNSATDDHKGW
jgi:hypothetical protein